jgi:hypothetical protein
MSWSAAMVTLTAQRSMNQADALENFSTQIAYQCREVLQQNIALQQTSSAFSFDA